MSRIFLSHSSADNAEALALRDWMQTEGWDDLFLDVDPTKGIVGGERWEQALHEAADRCEAVMFLISRSWLQSRWCLREMQLALKLNKRVFGVLLEEIDPSVLPIELTRDWQLVRLARGRPLQTFSVISPDGRETTVSFSQPGLDRLKAGMVKAGLDPKYFAWPPKGDPTRSPYPGLRALGIEDAGIFFGREAQVISGLDRLRGLSEGAPPRFWVVLSASGAGKSSYLYAGLLARLRRDDQNFLPLTTVRPERAVLSGETGFIRALESSAKDRGVALSRSDVAAAIERGAESIGMLLSSLITKTRRFGADEVDKRPPSVVLSIDQAEELFLSEGAAEAEAFLALIRALAMLEQPRLIVVFTIRSDNFERLQQAKALEGIELQTYSLPPLPQGSYREVIEAPVRRLSETRSGLKLEAALTERLLADIEAGGSKDALPLLAFILERLYSEYGASGELRLKDYEALGGIGGSIEAAVEKALRAADRDEDVPKDRHERLMLLRRGMIPSLAGIDPLTGAPCRQVARFSEIPTDARPLLRHLVEQRLLATDISLESGEMTVEPAHEALLRQWGLLKGWLEESFAALTVLEGVQRATRDWVANAKDETWLAHSSGRLLDAEALDRESNYAAKLGRVERAYLAACRKRESEEQNRELERARQLASANAKVAEEAERAAEATRRRESATRLGLIAASLLFIAATVAAWWGFQNAEEADAQRIAAQELAETADAARAQALKNESTSLAALSQVAFERGETADAVALALTAWPRLGAEEVPTLQRVADVLGTALPRNLELVRLQVNEALIVSAVFSPDGGQVLSASSDGTARLWDASSGEELRVFVGHTDEVSSAVFSPDAQYVLTASKDGTTRLWSTETGEELQLFAEDGGAASSAIFSPDGTQILVLTADKAAKLFEVATATMIRVFQNESRAINTAAFMPGGSAILLTFDNGDMSLRSTTTGHELVRFLGHYDVVNSVVFSTDASRFLTASMDRTVRLWETATGRELQRFLGHDDGISTAAFSPDGSLIVTASWDKTARLWDVASGQEQLRLSGHQDWVTTANFSQDGLRVVTTSWDKTARIWSAITGQEFRRFILNGEREPSAVLSPNGQLALTVSGDKTARLWKAADDPELQRFVGHEDWVTSAVFSPDGQAVLTASGDSTARLWNAVTGVELQRFVGHEDWVASADFSHDGSQILTASGDGTVRLWQTASGEEIKRFTGHEDEVLSATFSPDGNWIATASKDGTARLWDAETGAELQRFIGHEDWVNSAVFSPDVTRVLTASNDDTVRLWDANTGEELKLYLGHRDWVTSAIFSSDGGRVVTTSEDKNAFLWDVETGEILQRFTGHEDGIATVMFSPDGTQVLTASADKTARLWDTATGYELRRFAMIDNGFSLDLFTPNNAQMESRIGLSFRGGSAVSSASFSPDGSQVLLAYEDETARIWSNSDMSGDLFRIGCHQLGEWFKLEALESRYGLTNVVAICGENLPLPLSSARLE